jgi:hypothetical protein
LIIEPCQRRRSLEGGNRFSSSFCSCSFHEFEIIIRVLFASLAIAVVIGSSPFPDRHPERSQGSAFRSFRQKLQTPCQTRALGIDDPFLTEDIRLEILFFAGARRFRLVLLFGLVAAGFATSRAVVKALMAEPHVDLALAQGAVFLTLTALFAQLALGADEFCLACHERNSSAGRGRGKVSLVIGESGAKVPIFWQILTRIANACPAPYSGHSYCGERRHQAAVADGTLLKPLARAC